MDVTSYPVALPQVAAKLVSCSPGAHFLSGAQKIFRGSLRVHAPYFLPCHLKFYLDNPVSCLLF